MLKSINQRIWPTPINLPSEPVPGIYAKLYGLEVIFQSEKASSLEKRVSNASLPWPTSPGESCDTILDETPLQFVSTCRQAVEEEVEPMPVITAPRLRQPFALYPSIDDS